MSAHAAAMLAAPPLALAAARVKRADSDSEFEQALADMAYSQLASRSPKLFRFAVAFQLVEQSDDKKAAVGLFVFRAGKKWAQVPVFYRNGEIRGTEILILGPDDFFPLSEEAVNNFLANPAERTAGRGVSRGETARYSAPNLWQLNTPPTKWARSDELKTLARARKSAGPRPEVGDVLAAAAAKSAKVAAALGRFLARYPLMAAALAPCLDGPALKAAADAHKKRAAAPPPHPVLRPRPLPRPAPVLDLPGTARPTAKHAAEEPGGVTVIRVTRTSLTVGPVVAGLGLSPGERSVLLQGLNAYRDDRPEGGLTKVVDWGTGHSVDWAGATPSAGQGRAENPAAGADVYAVVGADGDPVECLVASAPAAPGCHYEDQALVLKLGDKAHTLVPRNDVWVLGAHHGKFKEWFDGLAEAGEPEDLPERFLLVDPKGAVTAPLTNAGPRSGLSGVAVYPAYPEHEGPSWASPTRREKPYGEAPWDHFGVASGRRDPDAADHRELAERARPRTVARTPGNAGKFLLTGNTLYYPPGTKVVPLPKRDKVLPLGGWDAGQDPLAFRAKKAGAGLPRLEVRRHGEGGFAASARGVTRYSGGRTDLEADLVEAFGLGVPEARKLAALAARDGGLVARVKFAADYPLGDQAVGDQDSAAPPFPFLGDQALGGGILDEVVPSVLPQQAAVDVQTMHPSATDYQRYRAYPLEAGITGQIPGVQPGNDPGGVGSGPDPGSDPELMKFLTSAAQSGSKEVVSAGLLGSILQTEDADEVLGALLPAMRKLITATGRALCHMYWRMDGYEERYGRIEAGTLLDQLRANFTNLGKLYLSLAEKASDRVVSSHSVLPDMADEQTGPSGM